MQIKTKILFIINPLSGVGKQKVVEKLIEQKLNKSIFDSEIKYTKARKHATELARKAAQDSFNIVVVVGGDGTVNEVGKGLIGSNTAMAILPCGSGNGFARHFKIPMNLTKAIEIINRVKTKTIDTFYLNDEAVINCAGIGYAAHIAHAFSKLKNRGFKNYLKISILDSMKYKSQLCEIKFNGIKRMENLFILDIANGSQWGNNATIAPHAICDDGFLELCLVRKFPLILFPVMATRLFTKLIHRSNYVEIIKIKSAVIRQQYTYTHIDGEPEETGKELRIKINPLSLKIIIP